MMLSNKNKKTFERSKLNVLLTLGLMVLSGVIFMQDQQNRFDDIKNDLNNAIVRPIKSSAKWPARFVSSIKDLSHDKAALLEEVRRQKSEITRLRAHLSNINTMAAENRRLKSLLESSAQFSRPVSISEVTDSLIDANRHQISLNKGAEQGVFVGQIVIDENGIVGQVTNLLDDSAVVDLITDTRQRVPVYVARNRLRMMAVGTGFLDELELKFVSKDADIRVGDVLVTSGLGKRFPRGYQVGVITSVDRNPADLFPVVRAKPVAALGKVLEVLLVSNSTEELERVAKQRASEVEKAYLSNRSKTGLELSADVSPAGTKTE